MAKYTAMVQYTHWYELNFESKSKTKLKERALEIACETDLDTLNCVDSEMKITRIDGGRK
jgi:hypothetical protein